MKKMKLKWIKKVYSDGKHNAFTGLAFFKDRYFLAFRHAVRHSFPAGCQIVMTSPDGENWQPQKNTAFLSPPGVPAGTPMDSRDCYFLNLGHELRLYSFAIAPLLPSDEWMIPPYSTVQINRQRMAGNTPEYYMLSPSGTNLKDMKSMGNLVVRR